MSILFAGSAFAFEVPGNPDRFPSIGVNARYDGTTSGSENVNTGAASTSQNAGLREFSGILDARVPINSYLTVTGAFSLGNETSTTDGTVLLPGTAFSATTYAVEVGVRVYIH